MRDGTKMLLSFGVVLCIAFAVCDKNENVTIESEPVVVENEVVEVETEFENVQHKDTANQYDPYMWYLDMFGKNNGTLSFINADGSFVNYRFIDEKPMIVGSGCGEISTGDSYAMWFDDDYMTNGKVSFAWHFDEGWFVDFDMPEGWIVFLKDTVNVIGTCMFFENTGEYHYIKW